MLYGHQCILARLFLSLVHLAKFLFHLFFRQFLQTMFCRYQDWILLMFHCWSVVSLLVLLLIRYMIVNINFTMWHLLLIYQLSESMLRLETFSSIYWPVLLQLFLLSLPIFFPFPLIHAPVYSILTPFLLISTPFSSIPTPLLSNSYPLLFRFLSAPIHHYSFIPLVHLFQ